MSGVFGNPWLYNANPPFYNYLINQSLRFDIASSTNLTRTAGSPSDGKKATWSWWMKKSDVVSDTSTSYRTIFYSGSPNSDGFSIAFMRYGTDHYHELIVKQDNGASAAHMFLYTNAFYRDVSSFYHFVVSYDSTDSTAADRIKIYVNGTRQTINTSGSNTNPSLNHIPSFQVSGKTLRIGEGRTDADEHIGGYLAEVVFIDGTAYDASNFGETTEGVWVAKDSSGLTFGNNGFYLPFDDSSAIGDDESSNTNDFTANNFSAHDVVPDSPTNNFAVGNPLSSQSNNTFTEGNLKVTGSGVNYYNYLSSMGMETGGKYYFEVYSNRRDSSYWAVGICKPNVFAHGMSVYNTAGSMALQQGASVYYLNSAIGTTTNRYNSTAYLFSFAIDLENNIFHFRADGGTWENSGDPAGGSGGYAIPAAMQGETLMPWFGPNGGNFQILNFGQDSSFAGNKTSGSAGASDANGVGDFYYAVPSGFLSLASASLPEPSIIDGSNHFNTVLYTGNSGTQEVTGVGFKTAFLWGKTRNDTFSHALHDSVRGFGQRLVTNDDVVESTRADSITAVGSDSFTLGSQGDLNTSGKTMVAWNWKLGGDSPTKTYKVVVVSDSGNKYRFRNSADDTTYAASAVTLDLQEGGTYTFDQSDSSNSGHPFRFYTAADKSGGEYTTGVTTSGTAGSAGATVTIILAASAPTLYYQCSAHAGMGGQINTNSTHGSTNFDGTLIATVSANVEAGFSIATWTGNNVENTIIPHGLGGTIDCVITKSRTIVTSPWLFLHSAIASDTANILRLNATAAATNGSSTLAYGNPEELTSVGFKLGRGTSSSMNYVNGTGRTYVGYCFKNVDGFLKCGEYTGGGGTDGSYVHLGFRPVFVLLKENTVRNWVISYDDETYYNGLTHSLFPNITQAEDENVRLDFLSNGFKLRTTSTSWNDTGGSFIYIAFADQPQKYSNAR